MYERNNTVVCYCQNVSLEFYNNVVVIYENTLYYAQNDVIYKYDCSVWNKLISCVCDVVVIYSISTNNFARLKLDKDFAKLIPNMNITNQLSIVYFAEEISNNDIIVIKALCCTNCNIFIFMNNASLCYELINMQSCDATSKILCVDYNNKKSYAEITKCSKIMLWKRNCVAIKSNLVNMINDFNLRSREDNFALWFTGKKYNNDSFNSDNQNDLLCFSVNNTNKKLITCTKCVYINFFVGEPITLSHVSDFVASDDELIMFFKKFVSASDKIKNDNLIIRGLWVGNELSEMCNICIKSFLKNNHLFVLYTYNHVNNVPDGTIVIDASSILSKSMIYYYDNRLAGFSDLFRNKLLFDKGGWYVDLDIYCVKPFNFNNDVIFSLDSLQSNEQIMMYKKNNMLLKEKFYVPTNPIKMIKNHKMLKDMYEHIFIKMFSKKIKNLFETHSSMSINNLYELFDNSSVNNSIDEYVKIKNVTVDKNIVMTFDEFCEKFNVCSSDYIGQQSWGEFGPILLSKKVCEYNKQEFAMSPTYFNIIPYFEFYKFNSVGTDWKKIIDSKNIYSFDFYNTMWSRKNMIPDKTNNTLYKYLYDLVN